MVLHVRGRWYASELDVGSAAIPETLRRRSEPGPEGGQVAHLFAQIAGRPRLVVGVPVAAADAVVYEVAPLDELQTALRVLATVLSAGTLAATGLAALVGARLAQQVLRPLAPLSSTAAAIAGGDLHSRLPSTRDPDLATIVGSFNSMVDALQQRIEREARFTADVSHELRSPLTALVTSVELLNARRQELSPRSRQVLGLLTEELERFQALLRDLLELASRDAGTPLTTAPVALDVLARHTLGASGRSGLLLRTCGSGPFVVAGDKLRLERSEQAAGQRRPARRGRHGSARRAGRRHGPGGRRGRGPRRAGGAPGPHLRALRHGERTPSQLSQHGPRAGAGARDGRGARRHGALRSPARRRRPLPADAPGRPMTARSRSALGAVLALVVVGCGVPSRAAPSTVDPSEVPYGLLAEASPDPSPHMDDPALAGRPRTFYTSGERLVGVPLDSSLPAPLPAVIEALSNGPDPESRDRGLGTAIPPGLTLAVIRVEQGTATIDLRGEPGPVGEQGPLAVGQIVLTATSVPTVDRVLLTRQGQPLEAQLPDGGLTSAPLSAPDFAGLRLPPH